MKILFPFICCLSVLGCIVPDESESSSLPTQDAEHYSGVSHSEGNNPCLEETMVHVVVGGSDFWVGIPSAVCSNVPSVYQGDPAPDFINPVTDLDLYTKDEIDNQINFILNDFTWSESLSKTAR